MANKENPYVKAFAAFCKGRCQENKQGWGQNDSLDACLALFQEANGDLTEEDRENMRACLNIVVNPSAARQTFESEKYKWLEKSEGGKRSGKTILLA